MSNLSINVEMLAGTDIKDAIQEAKELATRMGIAYVCFNFNGVEFSVGQKANVTEAIEMLHEAMKHGKMKFVVAN